MLAKPGSGADAARWAVSGRSCRSAGQTPAMRCSRGRGNVSGSMRHLQTAACNGRLYVLCCRAFSSTIAKSTPELASPPMPHGHSMAGPHTCCVVRWGRYRYMATTVQRPQCPACAMACRSALFSRGLAAGLQLVYRASKSGAAIPGSLTSTCAATPAIAFRWARGLGTGRTRYIIGPTHSQAPTRVSRCCGKLRASERAARLQS